MLLDSVEAAVGPTSMSRGRRYARTNRVLSLAHDFETGELHGRVIGNGGLYEVSAVLAVENGQFELVDGECTCPIGWNCKHVAALTIAAIDRNELTAAPPAPAPSSWEAPLHPLLGSPAARAAGIPLAFELKLERRVVGSTNTPRLSVRLMRPGARGGWINGSLAWDGLESWNRGVGDLRRDHVALAKELRALQRSGTGLTYQSSYGSDKTLDLGAFDSPRLWALLEEAAQSGLTLLHADDALGEVAPVVSGEVRLDVVGGPDGGLVVAAVLQLDGGEVSEWEPVLFLGASGHGLACAAGDPGPDLGRRPLRLVRLARPAPTALQELLLGGLRLEVPAGDRDRFTLEYSPALQRIAPLVSSDGSFVAPELSAPELVLRAAYGGADHAVDVGWEWRYRVGERTLRAPLSEPAGPAGFRDLEAERALLAAADVEHTGLADFGLLDDRGRPTRRPPVRLTAMDTVRLTTECLPELTERMGLALEIEGEATDFRDVGASVQIGVSTAQPAGERDWFDLGVSITVEGREVPFTTVFAALACGETHILLPDGAHFSLLDPRLQTLRQLIEEARELGDTAAGSLRISRYQSGLWLELVALGIVTEQAEAWRRQVDAVASLETLAVHALPPGLRAELRPYQRDGFSWLATLWDIGLGGILADDMGLGKTLQALALICHARDREPDAGRLPGRRSDERRAQLGRRGGTLRPRPEGDDRHGHAGQVGAGPRRAWPTRTWWSRPTRCCAWTSSATPACRGRACCSTRRSTSRTIRPRRIAACASFAAPFKLAITGTPMENNLMELWSLLSITAPGLFPIPKRFAERYARPIEREADREQLARLRGRIKPLVKRRTKELVAAELPERQEQILALDLHPRHRRIYDTRLQRERQKVLGLLEDMDKHRFTILRSLTVLRQLSLHPGLVDDSAAKIPCVKLDALSEHAREVAQGGHRALVFSQFTSFLGLVRERLDQEGVGYCYLDGRTRQRQRVLERFKTGSAPVFLISLKAGGSGLNLTEADYCFLLDPWWNPATEQQAIDRIHRIGQTRPVNVYRCSPATRSRRRSSSWRGARPSCSAVSWMPAICSPAASPPPMSAACWHSRAR